MENLWNLTIEEKEILSPKKIFEEQSKFLKEITQNKVYLEVIEYEPGGIVYEVPKKELDIQNMLGIKEIKGDPIPNNSKVIHFQVNIRIAKRDYFLYNVLTFYHNIFFYPINIDINKDMQFEDKGHYVAENEKELCDIIRNVFATEKMSKVVNNLYSMG